MITSLRDRSALALVRSSGSRGRAGAVTVRFVAGDVPGLAVAFAIGRRTGNAVVRNRIRRRLRAALDDLGRADRVPDGAAVISGAVSLRSMPYEELTRDLERALTRAATAAPRPSS